MSDTWRKANKARIEACESYRLTLRKWVLTEIEESSEPVSCREIARRLNASGLKSKEGGKLSHVQVKRALDEYHGELIAAMSKCVKLSIDDKEAAHCKSVDVLRDFVRSLGYSDIVDEFDRISRWY